MNALTHNDLNLDEEMVFIFNKGIPGFEQYTKYMFIKHDENFNLLQSLENEELAFIVTNPFTFFSDYEFALTVPDREELRLTDQSEVGVCTIVTWGDELSSVTTNLMAPIVLNTRERLGKQVVLVNSGYTTKHPLVKSKPAVIKGDEPRASIEP
ncbi:flagellar assembly protein FliW [Paenibacillus rubinfantis]|uniref:flagellar assembly protein FliW n=1 Tax=Paenibacillus rubinfantis TaxID=1720296 RepID=UPI00073F87F5|nr:flagellar assembly protein FliW [Paenibacillus rubinfantis]